MWIDIHLLLYGLIILIGVLQITCIPISNSPSNPQRDVQQSGRTFDSGDILGLYDGDDDISRRKHHKKRRRPCGRSLSDDQNDPRTFLNLDLAYTGIHVNGNGYGGCIPSYGIHYGGNGGHGGHGSHGSHGGGGGIGGGGIGGGGLGGGGGVGVSDEGSPVQADAVGGGGGGGSGLLGNGIVFGNTGWLGTSGPLAGLLNGATSNLFGGGGGAAFDSARPPGSGLADGVGGGGGGGGSSGWLTPNGPLANLFNTATSNLFNGGGPSFDFGNRPTPIVNPGVDTSSSGSETVPEVPSESTDPYDQTDVSTDYDPVKPVTEEAEDGGNSVKYRPPNRYGTRTTKRPNSNYNRLTNNNYRPNYNSPQYNKPNYNNNYNRPYNYNQNYNQNYNRPNNNYYNNYSNRPGSNGNRITSNSKPNPSYTRPQSSYNQNNYNQNYNNYNRPNNNRISANNRPNSQYQRPQNNYQNTNYSKPKPGSNRGLVSDIVKEFYSLF